jgi:hypothetical protein
VVVEDTEMGCRGDEIFLIFLLFLFYMAGMPGVEVEYFLHPLINVFIFLGLPIGIMLSRWFYSNEDGIEIADTGARVDFVDGIALVEFGWTNGQKSYLYVCFEGHYWVDPFDQSGNSLDE